MNLLAFALCILFEIWSGLGLEIDDHDSHVIASNALRCTGIVADDFIQHLAANLNRSLVVNAIANVFDGLLVCQAVPNSITSKDEKLICWIKGDLNNVGLSGDHLTRRWDTGHLLVFHITNGPREVEIAIDTAKLIDKATGRGNAIAFSILQRLVIKGKRFRHSTCPAQNGTRVACVGDRYRVSDQYSYNGCTTSVNWMVRKVANLLPQEYQQNKRKNESFDLVFVVAVKKSKSQSSEQKPSLRLTCRPF